ncbi:MAG: DUF3140 domain-containing protein [Methylobacterium sp.]|uniref:DUF3140 domain-containing protein n=1 Tax=Methylobacterium sp. TaxID=409 RepID=UPI0025DE4CA9|nr:DUF3140 domain-containing protein [Methylobacterium sp.]MBX9931768.1 DUF3140 domain-containing protein [Methylobacterium sp.]
MADDHDTTGQEKVWTEFKDAVNMTASTLETFLETQESRSVGQKSSEGAESTGHAEGRRIVTILRKTKSELDEEDFAHMRKVVGYVHRHLKQGGPKDADKMKDSPWRLSLMNWGHDPMKD